MQKLVIDPSIAAELDIKPVSYVDKTPLYFEIEGTEKWTGQFELKLWNSSKKNVQFPITGTNPITHQDKMMTWIIHPSNQGLAVGTYYFEIFSEEFERIIYKGILPIID
jgi:hypothetical protein